MKILIVNIPSGAEDGPVGDFVRDFYVPMLKRNFGLVMNPDTELTFRFCDWGMGPEEVAHYRYLDHLACRMVFYACQHAKEEGFDAVLIDCYGDPMLWEIRQALDIPVIGLGECAFGPALQMGLKFGVVHISEPNIPESEELLHRYGVIGRCAGTVPLPGWEHELVPGTPEVIDAFLAAAKKLVAMGAEVIIPGCSVLSPEVRFAIGAEDRFPNGITEVDGAAVFDLMSNAIKETERAAAIYRAGSGWLSRKNLFARPTRFALDCAEHLLADPGFHYWDVV